MTRINVVPVSELSDQHLLAEYHELPRCIKQPINIDEDVPTSYKLGKGHMKWAKMHSLWLTYRYDQLIKEMKYRGFKPNYTLLMLQDYWINEQHLAGNLWYYVTDTDILLNRGRLIYKYCLKPEFYTWTNRKKPYYYPVN
jgi:deoxyribonuclease (pyrimidine dimer)